MTRPEDSGAAAFQISVAPSGRSFQSQGDETILAAAIRSGVGLPYGCKDGAWRLLQVQEAQRLE